MRVRLLPVPFTIQRHLRLFRRLFTAISAVAALLKQLGARRRPLLFLFSLKIPASGHVQVTDGNSKTGVLGLRFACSRIRSQGFAF